ncbi:methyltransferase domain-containing protein [Bradyrhizobium sp. USDA 4504]
MEMGTVLELGTKRVGTRPSTQRRSWVADTVRCVASDFEAGQDVDIVADDDAERLSEFFAQSSIDAIIACSVFEHIRKPWLAAAEMGKLLRRGGLVFVQTHHTYPLHAYPFDYWRFSCETMETLFSAESGFADQSSWYDFPASGLRKPSLNSLDSRHS